MTLLDFKSRFHFSTTHCNLNNAGHAQIPDVYRETTLKWLNRMYEEGGLMSIAGWQEVEKARSQVAHFFGADSQELSFHMTTASALSQAASAIPLKAGDEILTWDQEYPSNFYPWRVAAERTGARLVQVASHNYQTNIEHLLSHVNQKTKVIAVSWVQYQTGSVSDLKRISEAVKDRDIWLVADLIQGAGVRPFDFHDFGFDMVGGGSHKWLCSSFGAAYLLTKKDRITQLTPLEVGAMTYGNPDTIKSFSLSAKESSHRFEPGSKAMVDVISLAAVTELLQAVGMQTIYNEATRLADQLRYGLIEKGFTLQCDSGPIVNFTGTDLDKIEKKLSLAKIAFAKRAGGIRLSTHAYNRDEEIDYFFRSLKK